MKFTAAILTLISALLLLGLAHHGYTENARIHAENQTIRRAGSRNIGPLATTDPNADGNWQAIDQAEEQGRLATAGLEGFVGVVLLFIAVALCGPANANPPIASSEYNLRGRFEREAANGTAQRNSSDSQSQSRADARSQPHTIRSGRIRAEELRKPKQKDDPLPSLGREPHRPDFRRWNPNRLDQASSKIHSRTPPHPRRHAGSDDQASEPRSA
jgi:hypothetical protein